MRISDWSSDVCSSDLLLDVDREGLLTVAVDDGGDAACPTHGAGGSLARPLARLGRQRKLFAHMHVSKNLGSKISAAHASRDDHVRGSGAYRRGQGGWQEMLLPSRSREGPGEGVWLVQPLPLIPPPKNGRACCRERGCQDVEISV